MKKPLDLAVADQIEALAVAIAMALVLKFFLIEAYQIPSGSMQPTILGDPGSGIFDRVLADKLTTMLRPPRRWEVMIFRFPNDERALYVKRIVGLPGESLEIRGGDVWVDGKIARKSEPVLDSVLKDIYPRTDGGIDLGRCFAAGAGVKIEGQRAEFAPGATGELAMRNSVHDDFLHGYDPDWDIQPNDQDGIVYAVADLEVGADVVIPNGGRFTCAIDSDEGSSSFDVALPAGGPTAEAAFTPANAAQPACSGSAAAGAVHAVAGRPVRVVARSVDHELVLKVGGDEVLRVPDDVTGPRTARPKKALVRFAIAGGGGGISNVRLRRDIFYTPPTSGEPHWDIPAGHYFALGDNTQGSYDSRGWKLRTYVFKAGAVRDGAGNPVMGWTGFDFDNPRAPDANPHRLPGGLLEFADVHGDTITFSERDVVSETRQAVPFIDSRNLLGKAIAVFWPVIHPFRWKLIR